MLPNVQRSPERDDTSLPKLPGNPELRRIHLFKDAGIELLKNDSNSPAFLLSKSLLLPLPSSPKRLVSLPRKNTVILCQAFFLLLARVLDRTHDFVVLEETSAG
jgi:hypothetical protein